MAVYPIKFIPKYDQEKHIINTEFDVCATIFESVLISKFNIRFISQHE